MRKAKVKLVLFAIRFLPEKKLNKLLNDTEARALKIAKDEKTRKRIEKLCDTSKDKKTKREIIRKIVLKAPISELVKAENQIAKEIKSAKKKEDLHEGISIKRRGFISTSLTAFGAAVGTGISVLLGMPALWVTLYAIIGSLMYHAVGRCVEEAFLFEDEQDD